jgi:hypothetical protein
VFCRGTVVVGAVVALVLFRSNWVDGVVVRSAEWRPTGMNGEDWVCSAGFGEGTHVVGVVVARASWPADPCQETRFSFAVLALDSDIQASVAATMAGWSLPCTLSHCELQVCRQWNRPQISTEPTFGMKLANRRTLSQSENDVRARLG